MNIKSWFHEHVAWPVEDFIKFNPPLWFSVLWAWAISIKYHFKLVGPYFGVRAFFHLWHAGYKVQAVTWPEYIKRIIEVETLKPQQEKAVRYKLMRPANLSKYISYKMYASCSQYFTTNIVSLDLDDVRVMDRAHEHAKCPCGWTKYSDSEKLHNGGMEGYIPDHVLRGKKEDE